MNLEKLSLEVKEFETPILDSNFEIVKQELNNYLDKFREIEYNEENIEIAKSDKATLNKLSKAIDTKRKEVKNKYTEPLKEFEAKCNELKALVDNQSSEIKKVTDEFDEKLRQQKKEECLKLYESKIEDLKEIISFEKVFNTSWLNKTYKISEVEKDIDGVINTVRDGLKAIEELHTEFEVEVKNEFLNNFDITKAILKHNQLQEQKTRLQKANEEKEKIIETKVDEMLEKPVPKEDIDPLKTYTLKITAPLSKQIALRKFLELNNMQFKKVD